jgi:hypothetical protein
MLAAARSPRRLDARCTSIAALLVPLLVFGALDLHSTELPHGALDGPGVVLTDARHPLAPEHLEASDSVVVPHCLACLLRTSTSCGAQAPPALEPDPVAAGGGLAPVAMLQPCSLADGLGSRGPPLA